MSSAGPPGFTISPAVAEAFKGLKLRRLHKFLIISVNPDSMELVVDEASAPTATPDDLFAALPTTDCRYVLYDHAYTSPDGRPQNKLYFILWAPDDSPSLSKMKYSSHKSAATKSMPGVFDIRCTCQREVELALGLVKEEAEESWDPDA